MQRLSAVPSVKRTTFSEDPVRAEPSIPEDDDEKPKARWLQVIDVRKWLRDVTAFEWDILFASTCLKLLLFPA